MLLSETVGQAGMAYLTGNDGSLQGIPGESCVLCRLDETTASCFTNKGHLLCDVDDSRCSSGCKPGRW